MPTNSPHHLAPGYRPGFANGVLVAAVVMPQGDVVSPLLLAIDWAPALYSFTHHCTRVDKPS